jgi:methylmalonyl-CoA mutase C-terminal domain/subunit
MRAAARSPGADECPEHRVERHELAGVVGVSFGMASYLAHCENLVAAMRDLGADDIPIMVGGLVHREDVQALNDAGVDGVFIPGRTLEVIEWLEKATGKSLARGQ